MAEGPFRFLDVQKLFSIAFEDKKSRRTLEYAIDFLHIEKDIPFHRAFSDAYYTAKILTFIPDYVMKNYSFDVFHLPKDKDSEIQVVFDDYIKYISRSFADKAAAIADRKVMSTKCYLCHKNLRKKIRWFTPNGKHYYSVSYCDKHGYMKAKVRLRKAEDDRIYVVKTEKFISKEEVDSLQAGYQKSKSSKSDRI